MNYTQILSEIYEEIQPYAQTGMQAGYIPELLKVNPDSYGICLRTIRGSEHAMGNSDDKFSIQSISKVFSLAMAFCLEGENLWKRVGVEPSGSAFNSVIQLEIGKGIPRNPFLNGGALVLSDILLSHFEHPEEIYLEFVRLLCDSQNISYNEKMATSEREQGYLNAAIANMLKYYGNIRNDIERVLQLYFRQCSLEMTCRELSRAFIHFADHKHPFSFGATMLTPSQVKRMNAIMQTCGFYDEAGEFSFLVGLPGKSGVGGGIAALCPGKFSVAVWSPRLNAKGNSIMGMKALELLTTKMKISIF